MPFYKARSEEDTNLDTRQKQEIGIRLPLPPIGNQVCRWGAFDAQNGMFFGQNVTNGIFVGIRRAGTDIIIPQSSWNIRS